MQQHNLTQGSAEWLAHRRQYFNASDAPAMMGCSPYKTRDQLLHEMHTGLAAEVDAATQRRFDDGHRIEALARPHAVAIIGEALFPLVGTEGKLSASSDGLTMDESINFEHKSLNDELRAVMTPTCTGADLPKYHRVQVEQQHMVFACEKTLFMASKWEGDMLIEERHCWYTSDPALRADIWAGWKQFEIDLSNYVPPAATAVVVPTPVQALPAVSIRVDGTIAVVNNFDLFEAAVRDFIENRLIRSPQTDQDFSDLELQIKAIKGAREAVKSGMAQMRAQIEPVDTASKRAELLDKLLQTNQSMAERLLSTEKDNRKRELLTEAQTKLGDHLRGLNERLGRDFMPQISADFAGAIYGKKSLDSMRAAVNTVLANSKIQANEAADKIQANLKTLDDLAAEHMFLFNDLGTVVHKAADDFKALVQNRVAAHKADQLAKEEAIRQRIQEEERVKAENEARVKLEKEQADAREAQAQADRDVAAAAPAPAPAPVHVEQTAAPAAASTVNVVSMGERRPAPAPVAAPTTPPTLKLGEINARLAPTGLQTSGDGLRALGFEPAARNGTAVLYHETNWPLMLAAMVTGIEALQARQAA
jgi:predicted phage-related endonuclease